MKLLFSFLAIVFGVLAAVFAWRAFAGQPSSPLSAENQVQVAVSILPQKNIVERIGGELVSVEAMIPAGFSPATFEPTPEQIAFVSQADVYFRIGHIGFEQASMDELVQVNPSMRVVDTSVNNTLRMLEAHDHDHDNEHEDGEHEEDHHAEEGAHEEGSIDPHVWLAPKMVQEQAAVITAALQEIDPDNASVYQANFETLIADLQMLDQELTTAFAPIQGEVMLVYHPAFGYLADTYGFTQEHFEIEGKEPTLQQLQEVITLARAEDIRVVFVQKQFSTDSAAALAEQINGAVVAVDPLAPDYFANMRSLAQTIAENL